MRSERGGPEIEGCYAGRSGITQSINDGLGSTSSEGHSHNERRGGTGDGFWQPQRASSGRGRDKEILN